KMTDFLPPSDQAIYWKPSSFGAIRKLLKPHPRTFEKAQGFLKISAGISILDDNSRYSLPRPRQRLFASEG
ncbi:MAG: hypothetical protein FWE20_13050, partial [Defluviitaleaceae bacterium]|nr:hypothetical protein [Defluviitaleaceae bacterium]